MFKIGKLNNTSNENVKITSSKLEVIKAGVGGVGVVGYKLGLSFDITGEFYEIIKKSIRIHIYIYAERFRSDRISGKRLRGAQTSEYPVHP